jgi:hypothetical protein
MKTKFIWQRLEQLHQTPEWLAERCGLSESTMKRNVLRGVVPSKAALMLMAQALKCKLTDLLHEDEQEKIGA